MSIITAQPLLLKSPTLKLGILVETEACKKLSHRHLLDIPRIIFNT